MNKKRVFSFLLAIALPSLTLFAQEKEVEMADVFRESGKIYTVVAVLGVVLTGLIVYMVATERRLAKLEKEINK